MISIKQIEQLVIQTPEDKTKMIIDYLKEKIPSKLSPIIIQDNCKLSSSQVDILKKICEQTDDGNLLSVTINAVLQLHEQKNHEDSRLVMSGDFIHTNANFTHETIYQMIGRAKSKITIIGYWVFKMSDFFERLEKLSKNIEITFILNDEKIETHSKEIKKNWNKNTKPKILQLNRKLFSKEKLNKLHSKVIIIDDNEILITSANLTLVAMENNIETGIWTKDKKIIEACIDIFEKFIKKRVFVPIPKTKYG